jgi:hypothetical protein
MNLEDAWEKLFQFVKNIVEIPKIHGLSILGSDAQVDKVYVPTRYY